MFKKKRRVVRSPRRGVSLSVQYSPIKGRFYGRTSNISSTGMFVHTRLFPQLGATFPLSVHLEKQRHVFPCRFVRCSADGVGVRFENLSPHSQKALNRTLKKWENLYQSN